MSKKETQLTKCGLPFTTDLLHPKYWLTWFGLLFAAILSLFPVRFRHMLGNKLGQYIYNNNQKRYRVVDTNLKIAFPELDEKSRDELILKHLQWYGCAMIEYSMLFFASKKRLSKRLAIDGKEHIDEAFKNNRSIIVLLAHSVMLEFGPAALGIHYEIFGSYKTSKNKVIDWMIGQARCRHVRFVVSREEGLRKLVKAIQPKRIMIFLPDEDLGKDNAVFVPFFNQKKATLTTTARLAKMGKAVALPAFSYYDSLSKKYRLQILPALEDYPTGNSEVDAIKLNHALETLIKQNPEQYMWLLKWYRTRPENEATLY